MKVEELKIKLDENIGYSIYNYLVTKGLDVETVRREGLGGERDEEVYIRVKKEERILVTLDRGFGNFVHYPIEKRFGIVILRPPKNFGIKDIKKVVEKFLKTTENNSPYGKLWIVSKERVREYDPIRRG